MNPIGRFRFYWRSTDSRCTVQHGYLSEHHSTGETAQKAEDHAEDMAMEMLATTLGLPNDPTLTWDQREEQWKLSEKIYKTQNFTQSAEGNKDGLWTTVISGSYIDFVIQIVLGFFHKTN